MSTNYDRISRCSRIVRGFLLAKGFDLDRKGAQALWYCGTLAAAQGLPAHCWECVRTYADYIGSSFGAVEVNMSNACRASGCGLTAWKLLEKMEKLGEFV